MYLNNQTTAEFYQEKVSNFEMVNATQVAKSLGWDVNLIVSADAAYECIDDLTGRQSAENRLRKLVIAANLANTAERKRFELPVLDSSLNLTNKFLEFKEDDGFTIIDLRS